MKKLIPLLMLVPAIAFAGPPVYKAGDTTGTMLAEGLICSDSGTARALACNSSGGLSVAGSYAEDAGHTSGDTGVAALSVRRDTQASSAGTTGDYATLNTDAVGGLWLAGSKVQNSNSESSTDSLIGIGWRRADALTNTWVNSSGNWGRSQADVYGALWTAPTTSSKRVCTAVTVTAGAYDANDDVGGVISFSGLMRGPRYSGQVVGITVHDKAGNGSDYTLIPLYTTLTGGTVTDGSGVTLSDTDIAAGTALSPALITSSVGFADNGYSFWTGLIEWVADSATPKAILTTPDTPTYASTSDVTVCVTVWQD